MRLGRERSRRKRRRCFGQWRRKKKNGRWRGNDRRRRRNNGKWRLLGRQSRSLGSKDGGWTSPWRNSSGINRGRRNKGGGCGRPGAMPWLLVKED